MNFKDEYIESILEINKNLRNQIENLYRLLRIKIKMELEENSRLENILNELEILKTSFSFNIQKNSNIVSKIFLTTRKHEKSRIVTQFKGMCR